MFEDNHYINTDDSKYLEMRFNGLLNTLFNQMVKKNPEQKEAIRNDFIELKEQIKFNLKHYLVFKYTLYTTEVFLDQPLQNQDFIKMLKPLPLALKNKSQPIPVVKKSPNPFG